MSELPLTILHIEDNETNRYIVSRILRSAGFSVLEATSGEAGLQAVAAHQPDLVILDVKLPGLNGFEVCHQIKSDPTTSFIPVLHLSASFVKSQDKAQGLDSGADAYLAQPVEPIELLATVRSLMRIRQAEESALALAREWQTTFDSISDGVALLDREGKFLRCNAAMLKLLEQPMSEILGRPHWEITGRILGPVTGNCFKLAQQTLKRESIEIESKARWFAKTVDPVLDEQGAFAGAVFILTDITDRKQIEAERAQLLQREQAARTQAEAANRMKDEFLATLSHELRSPLNAMLGWLQLLNTRKFDEATRVRAMETIERNTRAQAQLVEDLLDVSRIIQGKLHLKVCPVNLAHIIEAAIETVQLSASAKEIQLQAVLDPAVDKVLGDANRLQQIVWNLLSNAIKFTPRGGRVEVKLESSEFSVLSSELEDSTQNSKFKTHHSKSYAQITVIDTGQGISPEFVPYVFDRFRQADSSTTRSYGGLGLGLAIVRHLVELHGGTVKAASPGEGQGSTFMVNLPLMPTRFEVNEVEPAPQIIVPEPDCEPSPNLQGVRVLIVDDEADAREFIIMALKLCGAEVLVAASVREALNTLSHLPVDVLVSDIGMPEEDGYSLIHKVKALAANQGRTIPVIALTAYARAEDRARAIAAGFQAHVAKPVEPLKLAAIVAKFSQDPEKVL